MNNALPDFILVVCADLSCADDIVSILNEKKAVALNIVTYGEWLEDAHMLKYHLLFVRPDGSWIYAKDAPARKVVKQEIITILDREACTN